MRFLILIYLSLLSCLSYAQNAIKDSLIVQFKNEKLSDSSRYEAGYKHFLNVMRQDLDSARVVAHELLIFSNNLQNLGLQAEANRLIGNTYAIQGQFENAQEFFLKSHDILLELDDKPSLATTKSNIGTVFYELGNYTQAQDYLLAALKLAEDVKDENGASRILNNLGNVHNDLRNNDEALDYYTRSLEIKKRLDQKQRFPAAYNNIGLIYINLRQYDLAIDNLTESAEIAKELGDKRSESRAYSNIGIAYSDLGDYAKALNYINSSITIKTEINDTDGLAHTYLYRGKNYLLMHRYENAKSDCMLSLDMNVVSGAQNLEKEACECISRALEAQGNYKSALAYNQRYNRLKDSLFNKEKTKEITRKEVSYQYEKQQLADSIAYHKKETIQQVAHEKDLNKQYTKFYITLIISIAIIAFLLYVYAKHKQNIKLKNLENEMLNSEIEFKQKDLTNLAVNISNNQEWAESLAERLKVLKASTGRQRISELDNLETEINNKIWVNKDSDNFYKQVDELSSAFYNKLTTNFSGLTKTDIRLCSLIKLNLNTKQIATLQNINPSSVKMSRNRLRKKLNLNPDDDLSAFLRTF